MELHSNSRRTSSPGSVPASYSQPCSSFSRRPRRELHSVFGQMCECDPLLKASCDTMQTVLETDEEAEEVGAKKFYGYEPNKTKLRSYRATQGFLVVILLLVSWLFPALYLFQSVEGRVLSFLGLAPLLTGFIFLIPHWFPHAETKATCNPVPLSQASVVVVEASDLSATVCKVATLRFHSVDYHVFDFRHVRFVFDSAAGEFVSQTYPTDPREEGTGWTLEPMALDKESALTWFRRNVIDVPLKTIPRLLVEEILHPFFIFQMCAVVLWALEEYFYYAACIFIVTTISAGIALYETRRNLKRLHTMAHQVYPVDVMDSQGNWKTVMSDELIPGDLIRLRHDFTAPCDALVLSGEFIVNESMLTGESIPVVKYAMPRTENVLKTPPKKHVVYCGTHIIQCRAAENEDVVCRVWRTGFSSVKGRLVRSILFPRPTKFRFYEDSFKFIGVLFVIALIGFCYSVTQFYKYSVPVGEIVLRALDLLTIAVPPALPAAMMIGTTFAINRLKKQRIYCISPPRVNVSGLVSIMCFDKTGTLTEDGLTLRFVQPVATEAAVFDKQIDVVDKWMRESIHSIGSGVLPVDTPVNSPLGDYVRPDLEHAMASCHSVRQLENDLVGDPLELTLLAASGFTLSETADGTVTLSRVPGLPSVLDRSTIELRILKRFDFSSDKQRMGVLVERTRRVKSHAGQSHNKEISSDTTIVKEIWFHVKGAPEVVAQRCSASAVPSSFEQNLRQYSHDGLRVLACASKQITLEDVNEFGNNWEEILPLITSAHLETNLHLTGLIAFENRLKPDTSDWLEVLHEGHVRSVMVTGDHVLTAISVARQCGIIHPGVHVYLGDVNPRNKTDVRWVDVDSGAEVAATKVLGPPLSARSLQKKGDDEGTSKLLRLTSFNNVDLEAESETRLRDANTSRSPSGFIMTDGSRNADSTPRSASPSLPKSSPTLPEGHRWSGTEGLMDLKGGALEGSPQGRLCQSTELFPSLGRIPWASFPPVSDRDGAVVAVTGPAFEILKTYKGGELAQVIRHGRVFARMTPAQKSQIVDFIAQHTDVVVGMCGDGANDCSALKAAYVGVSLSEAEASIAAPFTSDLGSISAVATLLREGRCALVTSYQCFKYMALYSIIQFTTVILLYRLNSNLSDWEYLYIDMFIILPVACLMGETHPSTKLVDKYPPQALLSFLVLASVIGHSVICIAFQVWATEHMLKSQDWYEPCETESDSDNFDCIENTTGFLFSNFQYVFVALAFSIGRPFRQPVYKNVPYSLMLVGALVLSCVFLLSDAKWIKDLFELVDIPENKFRMELFAVALANGLVTVAFEFVVIDQILPVWVEWYHLRQTQKKLQETNPADSEAYWGPS
eukprot:Rmarinus@m.10742